jgi:hypothetical protein
VKAFSVSQIAFLRGKIVFIDTIFYNIFIRLGGDREMSSKEIKKTLEKLEGKGKPTKDKESDFLKFKAEHTKNADKRKEAKKKDGEETYKNLTK